MSLDEMCVLIPESAVDYFIRKVGKPFLPASLVSLGQICELARGKNGAPVYLSRAEADDASAVGRVRHLISYCVITYNKGLFAYQRTKESAEGRLHGKHSIGFGGHITEEDMAGGTVTPHNLLLAAQREVGEELDIRHDSHWGYVGAIADSSSEVNSLHLGLVFENRLYLSNTLPPPTSRDEGIAELRLMDRETIRTDGEIKYESWSEILIDQVMTPRATTTFFC